MAIAVVSFGCFFNFGGPAKRLRAPLRGFGVDTRQVSIAIVREDPKYIPTLS